MPGEGVEPTPTRANARSSARPSRISHASEGPENAGPRTGAVQSVTHVTVAEFRRRMLALVRDLEASGYVEMARQMRALLDRWR
jgi:hypothetical protein